MGHFHGIVLGGDVGFLFAYVECVCDNPSLSSKCLFPYASNTIAVKSSRTYAFHSDVPPMLGNGSDVKGVLVLR